MNPDKAEHPFALSPADHHFLTRLILREPSLTVEMVQEQRLTAEGLIERQHGRLVATAAAYRLLGLEQPG